MAVTDAYFTAAEYRSRIGKDDTSDDIDILTDGKAIARYIERKVGRFFTKDASDATRVYLPRGSGVAAPGWAESENPYKYGGLTRILHIDDLVSVTSITIDDDRDGSFADDTALASTDYELLPRNAADGPESKPYTAIALTDYGTRNSFPPGSRVQVVGVYGWPSVPEAIKSAAINLAAILRLETPRASRSVSGDGEILEASYEARGIITDLMRVYKKVGF